MYTISSTVLKKNETSVAELGPEGKCVLEGKRKT